MNEAVRLADQIKANPNLLPQDKDALLIMLIDKLMAHAPENSQTNERSN